MTWMPALVALALHLSPAEAPATTPEARVEALYRAHFGGGQSFERTEKKERARFAAPLLALLDADLAASAAADEVVGLDFDPLTSSQEAMEGYHVGRATVTGTEAVVPVELRLGSERRKLRIHVVREGGAWKVSNVAYEEEDDLVAILRQLAAERKTR